MLEPLASIRSGLLADSALQKMIDDISKPFAGTSHYSKLMEEVLRPSAYLHSLHIGTDSSIEHARKILDETSVSAGLQHMLRSFEEANKQWVVPSALLEVMSPLRALQDQVGKLCLPVMDWGSAATLAKLLGSEGIESQLTALGINPDGSLNAKFVVQEEGIGLSRKTLELMALLSFILAVLVPIYQELSSAKWQASVDKRLEAQADALEGQRKMIESLSRLLEKALVQEAKRQEDRFVVRDRVAEVRSKPEHGSTVVGKLFPQEVVRPVSEDGKWIEVEYYHWLHQEYRTGWVLKKYLQRVARPVPAP
jgi:Bacterial SH3 domain